jgi:Ras-related C3 botulinum toxin substrate 1
MDEIKCTIIGDDDIGKTSILILFYNNSFYEDDVPNYVDNFSSSITYNEKKVTLSLVDTIGKEDYEKLRPLAYPGTKIFIICFSVVNPTSIENVKTKWIPEVKLHCPDVPFILCGTKTDLRDDPYMIKKLYDNEKKPVSYYEGEELKKKIGAVFYNEVSSKTQTGVKELFNNALSAILDEKKEIKKYTRKKKKECLIL